jgi:ABC-type transport system involved in cytochrome c biogenesis ATPase subunit
MHLLQSHLNEGGMIVVATHLPLDLEPMRILTLANPSASASPAVELL